MTIYANFDLRLAGAPGAYTVEVLDSPAGPSPAPAPLGGDPAGISTEAMGISDDAMQEAGRALWQCAFGDHGIAELWRLSLARVGPESGLRLRLIINAPGLAALPWELLYDPRPQPGHYLALDGRTPVVRFVPPRIDAAPWPADRSLRLLFSGASPARLPPLDLIAAWDGVERETSVLVAGERLAATRSGVTLSDLAAGLAQGSDIWHFVGHGTEGKLAFEDGQRGTASVDAQRLGALLAGEKVRLAVLNACHSTQAKGAAASVAEALVKADVPAVVAMQGEPFESVAARLREASMQPSPRARG